MRILFTGGGSAGHVTPNLALIHQAKLHQWQVFYIGSKNGIEKEIIAREQIPYYAISTGKLRRYLSWENLLTPLHVMAGILQAAFLCYRLKPQVVFSKGGFVAFPVVFGAWLNRIPVIAHESDYSPGLANRLSYPFVNKICLTFDETQQFFKNKHKITVTGTPLRESLLLGNAQQGKRFCGFDNNKKIILVMGGGLGASRVNQIIHQSLAELIKTYNVVHLCGKGKIDNSLAHANYRQFEYLYQELADVLACADIVVSRAGANSIYELVALHKAHILIPLAMASRGDQLHNADCFAKKGLSYVINEKELTPQTLLQAISEVSSAQQTIQQKLSNYNLQNGSATVFKLIQQTVLHEA